MAAVTAWDVAPGPRDMTFGLTGTYHLHARALMAPARQNVGMTFPSAVARSLYEQRAAIGSTLPGASAWRAKAVPIGSGDGLGKTRVFGVGVGLGEGGLASGLGAGSGLMGAREAGLGDELATSEVEQLLNRTTAATTPANLIHVQRGGAPLGHGRSPRLRNSLSTADAISSRDRSYRP